MASQAIAPHRVLRDVNEGFISPEAAARAYLVGVKLIGDEYVLDGEETARLRGQGR